MATTCCHHHNHTQVSSEQACRLVLCLPLLCGSRSALLARQDYTSQNSLHRVFPLGMGHGFWGWKWRRVCHFVFTLPPSTWPGGAWGVLWLLCLLPALPLPGVRRVFSCVMKGDNFSWSWRQLKWIWVQAGSGRTKSVQVQVFQLISVLLYMHLSAYSADLK